MNFSFFSFGYVVFLFSFYTSVKVYGKFDVFYKFALWRYCAKTWLLMVFFFSDKNPWEKDFQTDRFSRFSDYSRPEVRKTTLVQEATAEVPVPSHDSSESQRVTTIKEKVIIQILGFGIFIFEFSHTNIEK